MTEVIDPVVGLRHFVCVALVSFQNTGRDNPRMSSHGSLSVTIACSLSFGAVANLA